MRHVKLVREKKEMMASVSIATNNSNTTTTINSITITILGCYIRREMQGNDDVEVWPSC